MYWQTAKKYRLWLTIDRPDLSSERAPCMKKKESNCHLKKFKIWPSAPKGAWDQDELAQYSWNSNVLFSVDKKTPDQLRGRQVSASGARVGLRLVSLCGIANGSIAQNVGSSPGLKYQVPLTAWLLPAKPESAQESQEDGSGRSPRRVAGCICITIRSSAIHCGARNPGSGLRHCP
jgi:hypothetical protein